MGAWSHAQLRYVSTPTSGLGLPLHLGSQCLGRKKKSRPESFLVTLWALSEDPARSVAPPLTDTLQKGTCHTSDPSGRTANLTLGAKTAPCRCQCEREALAPSPPAHNRAAVHHRTSLVLLPTATQPLSWCVCCCCCFNFKQSGEGFQSYSLFVVP